MTLAKNGEPIDPPETGCKDSNTCLLRMQSGMAARIRPVDFATETEKWV
jgi:hypothetical protein